MQVSSVWFYKSKMSMSLPGLKPRCQQDCVPFWRSSERICASLASAFRHHLDSSPGKPLPLSSKPETLHPFAPTLLMLSHLFLITFRKILHFKWLVWLDWASWINQNNLPISVSLTLILSVKPAVLWKVTYSYRWGLGCGHVWKPLFCLWHHLTDFCFSSIAAVRCQK